MLFPHPLYSVRKTKGVFQKIFVFITVQLRVSGKLLWVYVISFLPFHRRHPRRTGSDFYSGVHFFYTVGFRFCTVGIFLSVGFRFVQWAKFVQWGFVFFYAVGGFLFSAGFRCFCTVGNLFTVGFRLYSVGDLFFFVQWIFVFVQGRIFTVGFDPFFHTVGDLFFSGFTLLYSGRIVTVGILFMGIFLIWLWALKLLCAFYIAGAFD
jgi:hypothetical protein